GTRGTRQPPGFLARIMMPIMIRVHRRGGDRFQGQNLLYLTTLGAKSGELRTNPVARFDDGEPGWIIVASAGGTAPHPGWYHNILANPHRVRAEVAGQPHRVAVAQLDGVARDRAWAAVVAESPRFQGYTKKTDRVL